MITVADLIKAITKKLKANFPNVKVWSTDKTEDFGKKCFFIRHTASRDGKPDFIRDRGEIRVYYFPSDENLNQQELIDMQEQLSQLFLFRSPGDDFIFIRNRLCRYADMLQAASCTTGV